MIRALALLLALTAPAAAWVEPDNPTFDRTEAVIRAAAPGSTITLPKQLGGSIARVIFQVREAKAKRLTVRLAGDVYSSSTMWLGYAGTCLMRGVNAHAHYATRGRRGIDYAATRTMMRNTVQTVAAAMQAAAKAKRPGNPTVEIKGALLIARGEARQCE